tara:strand:- start:243 stop:1178 length:936 start_codon:yes stop_codon:yes gene_type:complete
MAVRSPLKNDSGNLKEMSSAEVDSVVDQIIYQYSLNPGVSLSVAGSGGNLSSINDTRLEAGAVASTNSSFPSEATTDEPGTVTVAYQRISQSIASVSPTSDTGKLWPAYYTSSGHIQAMSLQDVKDTFLHPAIDLLTSASTSTQQAGTYTIATSTSLAGSTLVSSTPIFVDTRADTTAYSQSTIGDHALDNPTTITSYYLHRINGNDNSYTSPMFVNASNNIQEYATATWESLVQEWIRYTAASSTDGYKITYSIGSSGSGNTRGTAIANTILNGSGNYQTRQVGDDYRAQEFPDGTPTTANTYNLRIIKS